MNLPSNKAGAASSQPKTANIITCAKREDPFARIPKTVLDDNRLSWRAKGILSYLIGKPAGWKTRVADIRKHAKEGETAVRSALKELRTAGYAQLVRLCDDGGKVAEWVWKVSDSPIFHEPDGRNPHVGKPDVGIHHHSKNEGIKNDLSKNESEEAKETANEFAVDSLSFSSTWKPDGRTKKQKLASIQMPKEYPSEREFDHFVETNGLDGIAAYRGDLYDSTCRNKWHTWRGDLEKWVRIIDWRKFMSGLNATIDHAHN